MTSEIPSQTRPTAGHLSNKPLFEVLVFSLLLLPINLYFAYRLGHTTASGLTEGNSHFGLDFVNFWSGGFLATRFNVMPLYDVEAYNTWLQHTFNNADLNHRVFSYPPNALLFLAPFGALPYGVSYVLWMVLSIAAFWWVSFNRTDDSNTWLTIALTCSSAIVLCNLVFGQMGLFLACCFVGALRLLPSRPLLAGILIGVLTIKPQLGPLLLLVLAVRKEWLAIALASATALALFGASIAMWGFAPWMSYASETLHQQDTILREMSGFWSNQVASPFTALRLMDVSYNTAMLTQSVISIIVAATAIRVLRQKSSPWPLQVAVIACGAVLFTPYLLAYDLAIPMAALLWYIGDKTIFDSPAQKWIIIATSSIPFSISIVFQFLKIPVLCPTVMLCYAMLVHRALSFDQPSHTRSPA